MTENDAEAASARAGWPELPRREWGPTRDTLHLWTQIVGKVRMELTPWVNHSWSVTLYVTSRGLTTGPIPDHDRTFQLDFDFLDHELVVAASDGARRALPLRAQAVADFHAELFDTLEELALDVEIDPVPNEIEDAIPFPEDREHDAYEPAHARAIWGALVQADRVFRSFRARFVGKCSPVHFFWGANDLAVTRFSGREAPEHPGGFPNLPDAIAREAYSHEVSSAGFWPGNAAMPEPIFYSYAYPEPEGFSEATVRPEAAEYSTDLGEWVLPYEAVRTADAPDETLLAFLQDCWVAAAELGDWDREALERPAGWHPLGRER